MIDRAPFPSSNQHEEMKKGWQDFVDNYYFEEGDDDDKELAKLMQIFAQDFDIHQITKNKKIVQAFQSIGSAYNKLFSLIKMDEDTAARTVNQFGSHHLISLQAMMGSRYADNNHCYSNAALMESVKDGLIKIRYNAWKKY